MNKTVLTILLVVTMAVITYLIRLLPMLIFRKKIKSQFINSLLYYLPYAVLSAMTFPFIIYCVGNSVNDIISASIGTAVALTGAFTKRSLITVALLASVAVLGMELLLIYVI